MTRRAPADDFDDSELTVGEPADHAAGPLGVAHSLEHLHQQMGVVRATRTMLKINQKKGFDCPGCAWPEGKERHAAEFCENGAKAVAEEATERRIGADFFTRHSIADLGWRSGYWLGQQGRLTAPMLLDRDAEHYRPISWDDAFALIADEIAALGSPDEAAFYTSGRTSNEAAFVYQLFARKLGTNNLPDCSNMCHESSGVALTETIGIGKGSVSLEDVHTADLIVVAGQNPGTNHPRMLSALEKAKKAEAKIVSINPLPEAGLIRFLNPQKPSGVVGSGTTLSDLFLQIRLNGDLALFQAAGKRMLERDAADRAAGGPGLLDDAFIAEHCHGFDEYAAHVAGLDDAAVAEATGVSAAEIEEFVDLLVASERTVVCWAMGLTQHHNSVPTIREIVNLLLLRGNIGRPGAGVCPVRGHSNVQGDRTMGIYEKPAAEFLDALATEFDFAPPREHGYDTVEAIRAMRDGDVKVFFALGGNFVAATPDTEVTEAAMRQCSLTVHVSTKLNRSHVVHGQRALILPTLGRTEVDRQAGGEQFVSVEDSMSAVHASRGHLAPASPDLLSEVAIISRLAAAVLGDDDGLWEGFAGDYDTVRDRISRVIPGFEEFNTRIRDLDGFTLPHGPRDERRFTTTTGKANFTANEVAILQVPDGHLLLQTVRSHDQYNTTIYGLDDRYRGVRKGRRVVFVNPDDLIELGVADGALVDLVGVPDTPGGAARRAESFRVVGYPTARGCVAAYFPETNVLVPLDSTAAGSNTPTSKSVVVRLEPRP